ncbi:cytochrome P450 [Aspergillus costaricaensis CBS 115574]|uniref:Cytochrome P450 n=1 Tax=Aspergillus costaricaensis CBS 115574 TaxID=1448317 RepID=A0ACD1I2X8_9EURO|nr:cytochrome P450 [Aspergillus costaricaensis CBS 115574]RAK84844.1 cytochrome P450 [Aspergillus costaricaensis CBS 115574]
MANIYVDILYQHLDLCAFFSTLALCLLVTYLLVIIEDNPIVSAGPKPLSITGDVHQMLPQRLMEVVHKRNQGCDLLVNQGAIYSSRPLIIVPRMSPGFNSAVIPHGKQWQNHNLIIYSFLETTATLAELLESRDSEAELTPVSWQYTHDTWYYSLVEPFRLLDKANVQRETTRFHMEHFEIGKSASTWNWISSTELAYVIGTLQQVGFEAILTVLRLIIKSIAMRWQPPTPFAIPHATTQDDEYMGYQIPSGTVIIPNIWVMSFDPKIFPDPHKFKPERWIDNPDLEHSPFGFGRRICPGRHLGWNSIFILMARLMWAYNITHLYKDGKKIEIDPWDIKLTFTAASRPFKASFEVREPKKQEIIEREWENATKDPVQILGEIGRKTG